MAGTTEGGVRCGCGFSEPEGKLVNGPQSMSGAVGCHILAAALK